MQQFDLQIINNNSTILILNNNTYDNNLVDKLINYLNTAPGWLKGIVAGIAVVLALAFSAGKQFASGLAFGRGHKTALTGGGGGIMDMIKGKGKEAVQTPAVEDQRIAPSGGIRDGVVGR